MNKIDFHIHTVATQSDSKNFEFDLKTLKSYVESAHLSAIAITNHNCFLRDNFDDIKANLDIPVFPGVELNVSTAGSFGHVLVIANPDDLNEFADGMDALSSEYPDCNSHLSWSRIVEAFPKIREWLVIPHFRKSKQIDSVTLKQIDSLTGFDALEVANAKKWLTETDKIDKALVVFSDCRPGLRMPDEDPEDEHRFAYGFTYLQCKEMSFSAIKRALSNPTNVSVFESERDFEILPEALPVSKRINVVLGKRSSGKTFTLKRILDAYEDDDVLYIEQFEITNKAKKSVFDESVKKEDEAYFDSYFQPLQSAMDDYFQSDEEAHEDTVRAYCSAVIRFAESPVDEYSNCPIYKADEYSYEKDDAQEKNDAMLRRSARVLIDGKNRVDIVKQYVDLDRLHSLDERLRLLMKDAHVTRWQKKKCDEVVGKIKSELGKQSARKPLPSSAPIRDYFKLCYRKYRLSNLLEKFIQPVKLLDEPEYKYLKRRLRRMSSDSAEARRSCRVKIPQGTAVAGLFKKGVTSREKLSLLRGFDPIVRANACKLLFAIDTRIVVNDGSNSSLSGGQRAEYLLLHSIASASGKDVVLIDEPESSFDNPFLNRDVIRLLNDIAKNSTVFLVTHNNTLGVSLQPDCIIYTKKASDGSYRVYSGELSSTKLIDAEGHEISREEILLETMEAGLDAYLNRRHHYGIA